MALAYRTGSVNGLNALWDALDAFLTASSGSNGCGWTKVETVATRDAIYKTNGLDGKINGVYRVMASTAAANPFKVAYNPHVKFPWIMAMGYSAWTVGTPGTGIKPYGQVGPVMMGTRGGGTIAADSMTMHRYNAPVVPITTPATMNEVFVDGRTRKSKANESYEGLALCFDGRRKFWGTNTLTPTQVAWQDLVHGETNVGTGGILTSNQATPWVLVHDAVNDKDVAYGLNQTTTIAQQWVKFDMETKTYTTLAQPSWATASAPTGAALVWDGNDTIYAHHGNSTTEFAKYSISGNSWTNLTASPVARASNFAPGSSGNMNNAIYIPNSISGIGEDVIYIALAASGTVIYRYDVTANAWRSTSGTGALTAQSAIVSSFFLVFDGKDKIIHGFPNAGATNWYQSTVTTPNTWTNLGNPQSTNRAYASLNIINHVPAKVRSHATLDTYYWFLGDADAAVVVTKVMTPTPHYYWMYIGRFSSSNRTAIMTSTGGVSAGGRVSIPVDDSSAYSAGERIILFDPTTANSEVQNIFDVPDATHITVNLNQNYTTGTRIGLDPAQWCTAGNGVVMCPTDARGYNTDNEPCQMVLEPTIPPEGTDRSTPGAWGLFQPNPFTLFNPDINSSKYGNRGFTKYIGTLSGGVFPRPQSEEIIKINKKSWIYFEDTETKSYSKDMRGLVIGPID